MVAGARPKRTSDTLNSVSTDATAMSQAAISPMPPANAAPCTRATVGFANACSRASMAPKAFASFRFSSKSSSPILFIQFRSAPAQNTLPRPATTTARTTGSCSSSPNAAVSSAIIVSLKALRTSGRLSQSTATPRPAWISMVSCLMPLPPKLLCKSLARLDDHLGAHRIGDKAFLVGFVVQLGEHRRRRRYSEFDRGPQSDSRHRHAAFGILLEHAFRIVDVPVDDQLHRRGEIHEPEHVTRRKRGDEKLLRIGTLRVRCAGGNVLLCRVSLEPHGGLELDAMGAAVCVERERQAVSLPFSPCTVDGHAGFLYILKTPSRVSSIGALRDAEIASASVRRVSSGAITPS